MHNQSNYFKNVEVEVDLLIQVMLTPVVLTSLPVSCAGPVTNVVITAAPANMFLPDSRPSTPLPRFSRHLHASEGDGGESGEVCVRLGLYTQVSLQP